MGSREAQDPGQGLPCPSPRLVLLKGGNCLVALGKKWTAWRQWAGQSRQQAPAAQPAAGTLAKQVEGRGKVKSSPTQAHVQCWPKRKFDPYKETSAFTCLKQYQPLRPQGESTNKEDVTIIKTLSSLLLASEHHGKIERSPTRDVELGMWVLSPARLQDLTCIAHLRVPIHHCFLE